MSSAQTSLRIPYGVADYVKLRRGHEYYVDKTHYLPQLEQAGRFLLLIRPRRFGKSLLQSVMECYYDAEWSRQFDELFGGTWIHSHPTSERGQYLTLRFDPNGWRKRGSSYAVMPAIGACAKLWAGRSCIRWCCSIAAGSWCIPRSCRSRQRRIIATVALRYSEQWLLTLNIDMTYTAISS